MTQFTCAFWRIKYITKNVHVICKSRAILTFGCVSINSTLWIVKRSWLIMFFAGKWKLNTRISTLITRTQAIYFFLSCENLRFEIEIPSGFDCFTKYRDQWRVNVRNDLSQYWSENVHVPQLGRTQSRFDIQSLILTIVGWNSFQMKRSRLSSEILDESWRVSVGIAITDTMSHVSQKSFEKPEPGEKPSISHQTNFK